MMKRWKTCSRKVNQSDEHKKLLFEVFHQRKDVERISSDPQLAFNDHSKLSKIIHTGIGFW